MDIAIVWDSANARGDWAVTAGDLALDPGGLQSAVLVSLFTDRVAPADYVPPAGSMPGRRGWWGDTYEASPVGSLLWTLDRSKKTGAFTLLNQAKDYCKQALQWLVDDGAATSINVQTDWISPQTLGILVSILKPFALQPTDFRFEWAWSPQTQTLSSASVLVVKPPPTGLPTGVDLAHDEAGNQLYDEDGNPLFTAG